MSSRFQKPGCPILSRPHRERVGSSKGRLAQLLAIPLLATLMLGASNAEARYERDGHNLMCVCGCAEVLLECNHVGCTDSARMTAELHARLDGSAPGLNGIVPPDDAILKWFASKYGATVLAAPIRGGFDNVAWIMPFAVFLCGTLGTALLVRLWSRHRKPLGAPGLASETWVSPETQALKEKIRRETQYQ
jgi:hypothetical protein